MQWWEKECGELEELDRRGRSDLVYEKVRQLSKRNVSIAKGATAIKGSDGNMITEADEVRRRWKEYIEVLYDKRGKPTQEEMELENECNLEDDCKGPDLLDGEIRSAIEGLKCNKAVGVDDIPIELWKAIGEKGMSELVSLCKQIYENGVWPEDFTRLVLIPLPKKASATECEDYRTISLIGHASKILLKVLTRRIEAKVNEYISSNQFGFRKGCGTRDAIGVMRILCERSLEYGNDVYICFVDFEKAFDRVNWVKMMSVLTRWGVDWKDRRLIQDLYLRQEAVVRIADKDSEAGVIGRGVRQGCPLSPLLFSIYAEMMMKEAMESSEDGVKVGGELIRDVRFADDQGMVDNSEAGLQRTMDRLSKTAKEYDMKVNVKKTKAMVVSKDKGIVVNITVDGQQVEQVAKFKYLGSLLSEDGRSLEDVKVRIGMAKDAFNKRRELMTKSFSVDVKKSLIKSLIWPVVMYASETWTMRKEEMDRINAFEMWAWRRMERVSWKDKKTNEQILTEIGEQRSILYKILNRKKNWIGHVVRGHGLLKQVIEGRMEGRRGRGRPRTGMLDDLKETSYVNMKRRAEDREAWKVWVPRTCRKAEN